MVKNTIQILQDNKDSTLDNYADANQAAVVANEQMNEQSDKEQSEIDKAKHFKSIDDVPDDLL